MCITKRLPLSLALILALTLGNSALTNTHASADSSIPIHKVVVFLQGVGSKLERKGVSPADAALFVEGDNGHCTPANLQSDALQPDLLSDQYAGQYFSCIKNALLHNGFQMSDFLEFSY